MSATPGAFVVSLDFELEWGVRDTLALGGGYRDALLGAREAVPRTLDLFDAYSVAATWAAVGFLFAESRDELEAYAPTVRPAYPDPAMNPYAAQLGANEREDPVHYAPSLLREIASRPRQEVGSHTYSHYYCLEPGQTRETFDADLRSAVGLARARGITLRSLVFPRNQVREDYLEVLAGHGFRSYRGAEPGLPYRPRPHAAQQSPVLRGARLVDSYVNATGSGRIAWPRHPGPDRPVDVAGSRFMRPVGRSLRAAEPLRIARILGGMRAAAKTGGLYHLWWHPHNFGLDAEANFAVLTRILRERANLADRYGFESLTMDEVAGRVLRDGRTAVTG